ncbi:unnamed protein product [Effrenium voratum]|nr:unnamed protein product [Effrenium voratum]
MRLMSYDDVVEDWLLGDVFKMLFPPRCCRTFFQVFCLNLDGYPKRWSFMQRQLEALHMSATRWPVDGLAGLDVNDLSQLGLVKQHALKRYCLPAESKLHGIDLTAEGIGRALSHMQVWKHVAMNYEDDDMCLVLEDDCLFLPEFSLASLRERLAKVPANWQIVFLGGQDLLQKQRRLAAEGVHRLYRGFQGTTAYVVTASGCKACLEVTVPLSWQVDTHLAENEVQAGQITYTVKPRGYFLHPALVRQGQPPFPAKAAGSSQC